MKPGFVSVRIGLNSFRSSEIFQVQWFINLDGDVARRIPGTIWKRYELQYIPSFATRPSSSCYNWRISDYWCKYQILPIRFWYSSRIIINVYITSLNFMMQLQHFPFDSKIGKVRKESKCNFSISSWAKQVTFREGTSSCSYFICF